MLLGSVMGKMGRTERHPERGQWGEGRMSRGRAVDRGKDCRQVDGGYWTGSRARPSQDLKVLGLELMLGLPRQHFHHGKRQLQ